MVAAVHHYDPQLQLMVFDHGKGAGWRSDYVGGAAVRNPTHGANLSRRYWRADNVSVMQLAARFGLPNRAVTAVREAKAVLDVSGGDSFSDIYGARRFAQITVPKRLALATKTRLILLPQTYGPFRLPETRREAKRLVAGAAQAWARDEDSHAALLELMGEDADPAVHRRGVDMAFALEVHDAPAEVLEPLAARRREGRILVGLNVSGLTYNDPDASALFGFRLDYRQLIHRFMDELLADDRVVVLLVPHVDTTMPESDRLAASAVIETLPPHLRARVAVTPAGLDQCQVKGVIAAMDWFMGTRMHSTIAGLSTQTPTATVAYSLKARGVFASCDAADQVADARQLDLEQAMDVLRQSFATRADVRARLAVSVPPVRARAASQLTELLDVAMSAPARH